MGSGGLFNPCRQRLLVYQHYSGVHVLEDADDFGDLDGVHLRGRVSFRYRLQHGSGRVLLHFKGTLEQMSRDVSKQSPN